MESRDVIHHVDGGSGPSTRINGAGINTCIMHADHAAGGGDWCEAFAISDDVIALSIGDVCGHGIEKMGVMEALRDRLHVALAQGESPADALEETNRFLRAYDDDENATAIVALLDLGRRSLTFVNAGHPPPLMAGPYGATYLEFARPDVPIGVRAAIEPTTHVISVAASTLIVLYTDGVSEHEREPLKGSAELYAATVVAYALPATHPAIFLQERMALTDVNRDDAAILTVRMPLSPIARRSPSAMRRADSARAYA